MSNRNWPDAGDLENAAVTVAEMKAYFEAWLTATKTLNSGPAFDAELGGTLTIVSGSITPTGWYHKVATEGGVSSDVLDTIDATNLEAGAWLVLCASNPAHTIVVHDDGLAHIKMRGSISYSLDESDKYVVLMNVGAVVWREMFRVYGSNDTDWDQLMCTQMYALSTRKDSGTQYIQSDLQIGSGSTPTDLRIINNADPTLTSTTHAVQVGPDTNVNLCIGSGAIQVRDQIGAAATLDLQEHGGEVHVGGVQVWDKDNSGPGNGTAGLAGDCDMVDGAHAVALIDPGELWTVYNRATTTECGGFTSGSWQDRSLTASPIRNSIGAPADNDASTITLPAGTYKIHIRCAAYGVNSHQIRLYNVTDVKTDLIGMNAVAPTGTQNYSELTGTLTIAATKVFKIQHRCETTKATDGMGHANSFGESEQYVDAHFWKISL